MNGYYKKISGKFFLPKIFSTGITSLVGVLMLTSGCVTLYKPNVIYSPLLKRKGEINAAASFGMLGAGLYNMQSAYALNDHLGVMATGMYHTRTLKASDASVDHLNIFSAEAGMGYFKLMGAKENFLFQVYSGGGYGNSSDVLSGGPSQQPEINAQYFNLFLQPGIAYISPYFEMSFDARINYVNMYSIHAYLYDKFEWWNTDFHFHSDTTMNFTIVEPTLTCKAGGKNLKGCFQFGVTVPAFNTQAYFEANTASMLALPSLKFSAGVTYTFRKK